MTATTPLHDLGLRFTGSSRNITPEGVTGHYGGDSPWGNVPRHSRPAFRDGTDHARCASIARAWHAFHLSKGWFGFAYTSAVCPHGHRFEGRGPSKRTGANGTNEGNQRSYAVVYIAGGSDPLTGAAMVAFLDEAERLGVPMRWDHSDWKPTACAGDPFRAWEADGFSRPDAPTDGPTAPPPVRPPSIPETYRMDTLDLRNASASPVKGRHVDNLQGLMLAVLPFIGRDDLIPKLVAKNGAPDGIAGAGTAEALEVCQNAMLFFGRNIGAKRADRIAGPATWRALIEF